MCVSSGLFRVFAALRCELKCNYRLYSRSYPCVACRNRTLRCLFPVLSAFDQFVNPSLKPLSLSLSFSFYSIPFFTVTYYIQLPTQSAATADANSRTSSSGKTSTGPRPKKKILQQKQLKLSGSPPAAFIHMEQSTRGNQVLHIDGHKYVRNNVYGEQVYWKCTKWHSGCRARMITSLGNPTKFKSRREHNH